MTVSPDNTSPENAPSSKRVPKGRELIPARESANTLPDNRKQPKYKRVRDQLVNAGCLMMP
ncbi:MAG TPA: hypothetical protein DD409_06740 [Bacteroidales bacterium]|jgi:hypothetical protein|nr:hypothetical protein [Bacteroidales bacterium]